MTAPTAGDTTGLVLAIDVGGTTIKGELVDSAGTVVAATRAETPRGDEAVAAIGEVGDRLLAGAGAPVVAAGVVVPGLVDAAAGIAAYSANIGWRDLPVVAPLSQRWGVPVRLGHDVTAAAWAEARYGAGRGESDVCFVVIGTGVAGVILSGGRMVTGPRGEIAEIGHLPVRPGTRCACGGDGCVEAVASASAIATRYGELTGSPVPGAEDVVARLAGDDAVAREVWQQAIAALADGLAMLALVVAPRLVVVGGGLAAAGDALTDPLTRELKQRTRVVSPARVAVAELGARGGVVGAWLLALESWRTS